MEWDAKYAPPPPVMSALAPLTTNPDVLYAPATAATPGTVYGPTTATPTNPGG